MKSLAIIVTTIIIFFNLSNAQTEFFFSNPNTSGPANQIGYTGLYENVATFNSQSIDLKATIVDASDHSMITNLDFASDSGQDFRFNMRDNRVEVGNSIFAKVKFEFFYSGTHTPVNLSMDFTHDNIDEDNKSMDKVQIEFDELAAYTINDPTTLDISGTYIFSGTDQTGNNSDPEYAVTFNYENVSAFHITYTLVKKTNNSTSIFFRADGSGDLVTYSSETRVQGGSSLLPLDLIAFDVELKDKTAEISWITENEEVLSHFEIERSEDGTKFEKIETLNAKANNGELTYYSTFDNNVKNGFNYYRLKSVDLDGTYYYSEIEVVEIRNQNNADVQVYPNPTTEWVKVNAESTVDTINIMDMTGRSLINAEIQDSFGEVNVSDLPKGQYFISINFEGGENISKALIVQ